jgi:CubicO group peptidase (beta-lactamase class C family)
MIPIGFTIITVRRLSIATVVLLGIVVLEQRVETQALTFSLFEKYLDSFRAAAGIPGMSGAVVQNGVVVWQRGFGRRDVEAGQPATPETPYLIGGLSQTVGATLLLRHCVDSGLAILTDHVQRFAPQYPESETTLNQLLSHTAPGGGAYKHSPERFAGLTGVIEGCSGVPYRVLVASEILDRFAMTDSSPDQALSPTRQEADWFDQSRLTHYTQVIGRMATPYRVMSGRTQRAPATTPRRADASDGIISSARDLAKFDIMLTSPGVLLDPRTRDLAWTQAFEGSLPLPTGLGWFVQSYNGEPIVWQFGRGSHSSLIVKAPNRGLTFILLANSDGLGTPFALEPRDVTTSLFASLFLRFFVP